MNAVFYLFYSSTCFNCCKMERDDVVGPNLLQKVSKHVQ